MADYSPEKASGGGCHSRRVLALFTILQRVVIETLIVICECSQRWQPIPVGVALWLRFGEEAELRDRFGEQYAEYCRNVPAFWPQL